MAIGLRPNEDKNDDLALLTQTPRFAGHAKATAEGRGRLLYRFAKDLIHHTSKLVGSLRSWAGTESVSQGPHSPHERARGGLFGGERAPARQTAAEVSSCTDRGLALVCRTHDRTAGKAGRHALRAAVQPPVLPGSSRLRKLHQSCCGNNPIPIRASWLIQKSPRASSTPSVKP